MAKLSLHIQVHHRSCRLEVCVHGKNSLVRNLEEENRRPLPSPLISRIQAMPPSPKKQGVTPGALLQG
jgi:hypothetical protein